MSGGGVCTARIRDNTLSRSSSVVLIGVKSSPVDAAAYLAAKPSRSVSAWEISRARSLSGPSVRLRTSILPRRLPITVAISSLSAMLHPPTFPLSSAQGVTLFGRQEYTAPLAILLLRLNTKVPQPSPLCWRGPPGAVSVCVARVAQSGSVR